MIVEKLTKHSTLAKRVGWTTVGHVGTQAVRFGANLILTRLLAPDLFGLMMLITSLRVGLELFTDIGIVQNVVASPNARSPEFYNTAWTVQIIRGIVLCLISIILIPFAVFLYPHADISKVAPFVSAIFILTGLHSIGLPLAIKEMQTEKTSEFEIQSAILGSALIIICAYVERNIIGLLIGNILSTAVATLLSYRLCAELKHKILIDKRSLREIIGMGKWIFLMSLVFFLATNFDRLVVAKYATLSALGIYGLARSLAEVFGQFGGKLGSAIIFPTIAGGGLDGEDLRRSLSKQRHAFLLIACLAIAGFMAFSDLIVGFLYDHRYAAASSVLPIAAFAVWIGILNTFNENVLLGLRRPMYLAAGNICKLGALLTTLPIGVYKYGIVGAAASTALAEGMRYIALTLGERKVGVTFKSQDFALTLGLLALALLVRTALSWSGLTHSWF